MVSAFAPPTASHDYAAAPPGASPEGVTFLRPFGAAFVANARIHAFHHRDALNTAGAFFHEPDLQRHVLSMDDCADCDLVENCECRDTLTDLIENGTNAESENARCWLEHYLTCHDAQGCNNPANCPDDDPCGKH